MKDIQGYEGCYAVTEEGQVWSYYIKDYLSLNDNKGYLYVSLTKDGKKKLVAVHRLVAQAYIPNPNNLPEVNHKDENKKNNSVNNLEWCDRKYNANYGTAIQRMIETQQKYNVNQKAVLCVETGKIYHSTQEASRQTGVNNTGISKACNGKRQTAGGFHWQFI